MTPSSMRIFENFNVVPPGISRDSSSPVFLAIVSRVVAMSSILFLWAIRALFVVVALASRDLITMLFSL